MNFNNQDLNDFEIYNPLSTKKQRMDVKNMKKKVDKAIKIDDGSHDGVIDEVKYKNVEGKGGEQYTYVDIVIEEKKSEVKLKCGVPFNISENTALGQILLNFGAKLEEGKEIEVDDFIKEDMKVTFVTVTKTTNKGKFAEIMPVSLKPIK